MKVKSIDPDALIRRNVETNQLLAHRKNIRLGAEISPGLPAVNADPARVEQVLTNLISNAVKYSESATSVTVRASASGGEVLVEVTDQGQGIPAQELGNLFRFYQKTSVRPTGGEHSSGLECAFVARSSKLTVAELASRQKWGGAGRFISRSRATPPLRPSDTNITAEEMRDDRCRVEVQGRRGRCGSARSAIPISRLPG